MVDLTNVSYFDRIYRFSGERTDPQLRSVRLGTFGQGTDDARDRSVVTPTGRRLYEARKLRSATHGALHATIVDVQTAGETLGVGRKGNTNVTRKTAIAVL